MVSKIPFVHHQNESFANTTNAIPLTHTAPHPSCCLSNQEDRGLNSTVDADLPFSLSQLVIVVAAHVQKHELPTPLERVVATFPSQP